MTEDPRIEPLTQIALTYVQHDSWRCYSTRYPNECRCGLDDLLREAKLDPNDWARERV